MTTGAQFATQQAVLVAALQAAAVPAGLLDGVQVLSGYNDAPAERRSIYMGGIDLDIEQGVAESVGLMVVEKNVHRMYVRIMESPPCPVAQTNAACEVMAGVMAGVLKAYAWPAGMRFEGFIGGMVDYHQTGDETASILLLRTQILSMYAWG